MAASLDIVFPLYPGTSYLDFMGPQAVLAPLPGARLIFASVGGQPIHEGSLTLSSLTRLEDVERCDVLCVPGGPSAAVLRDEIFMAAIRRLGGSARYVTSVCTGSLLLAAAGLLEGKRAACHWAMRDLLAEFGAIPDPARVVRDGNILTGGGVTAGIDFGLTLAAELAGPLFAQAVQLIAEYAPEPPFNSGRPDIAPKEVLAHLGSSFGGLDLSADRAQIQLRAAELRAARA
ncbi:Transcriptional regulator, AraC family [Cystobacter fuscus DSM 2262]|uniref:Transcriptional regulator, AraC family n=1 Tax=Cystobacter fuscus (strain ATCC 25194 / DSM 2262 / NBRC 100088 / M29) TaxID=1242864 RepID=S9PN88_CYSF2|nr:DJ-1/PfpI family protein [Cystobacter fuscus]EPX63942.1 Transcriptional regulator, AraC family [Cystobacter fuscus DSM 2262]